MIGGCIEPPTREQEREKVMAESGERLAPMPRGPVNAQRKTPEDPPNPRLKDDVLQLSSEIPLERVQADNRLKQAGAEGMLATAAFLTDASSRPAQLVEALRFLASADLDVLETEQAEAVREAMLHCLTHDNAAVRVQASRGLQVHEPGAQRTLYLTAIGDPERRVRWAVVRYFSDHATDLDRDQRGILLAYLDAGTRTDFELNDTDRDQNLGPMEFKGTRDDFKKLDRNQDGAVSLDEWISPVPSEVRADVIALLLRIQSELTPGVKPASYNPWLPSSDQLDIVTRWKAWNEQVPEGTPKENE